MKHIGSKLMPHFFGSAFRNPLHYSFLGKFIAIINKLISLVISLGQLKGHPFIYVFQQNKRSDWALNFTETAVLC